MGTAFSTKVIMLTKINDVPTPLGLTIWEKELRFK